MNKLTKTVLTTSSTALLITAFSVTSFAHSGRTDSSSGHKDNKNKSGLGSYHYHCGNSPAHLHDSGYCLYTDVLPSKVTVSADKTALRLGETISASASVTPANSCDTYVTWSSSDPNVVSVSNGELCAVGYGTATIKAESFNGKIGSVKITVKEIKAEKVELSGVPSVDELYIGDSFALQAVIMPDNVDDPTIKWHSDNPDVASVTDDGKVTLLTSGQATITATASNGIASKQTFAVKERVVESIAIQETEALSLRLGDIHQVHAHVVPENASFPEITWVSANPQIVSISPTGTVTALSCGQTTLTAMATNGISTTLPVTVHEIVARVFPSSEHPLCGSVTKCR